MNDPLKYCGAFCNREATTPDTQLKTIHSALSYCDHAKPRQEWERKQERQERARSSQGHKAALLVLLDQEVSRVGQVVGALVALLLVQDKGPARSFAASAAPEVVFQRRVGGAEVNGEVDASQVCAATVVAGCVHTPVVVNDRARARAVGRGELMQVPAASVFGLDGAKAGR